MTRLEAILRAYPPEVRELWDGAGRPTDLRARAERLTRRLAAAGRLDATFVDVLCRYAAELDQQLALLRENREKEQLEEVLQNLSADQPLPPEWTAPPPADYPPWDGHELIAPLLPVPPRLQPLAALLLVLGFPDGPADPSQVADWASRASVLHYRNYELVEDNKVLTWHIAGLTTRHLRRQALSRPPSSGPAESHPVDDT
jgi:hypothetical protein